jgi:hypothetical protein
MEGSELDGGDRTAGREPEGTQLGVGAEESGRADTKPASRRLDHPIVEKDGVEFYEITRYSPKGQWVDYQPVNGDWTGNGSIPSNSPVVQAKAKLGKEQSALRKAERAMAYEDRVYKALDDVANLQTRIIELANDEGVELDKNQMEKLRLGLAAGESVLNRALGKAVTKIDAEVKHSVADEIAEIEANWTIDEG